MSAWILTGMSGAGKQTGLDALARDGVTGTDNLPVTLVEAWVKHPDAGARIAVVDARSGDAVREWIPPEGVRVIFLDATDDVLRKRLSESTRIHPCAAAGGAEAQIRAERAITEGLRAAADAVIDTSALSPKELGAQLRELILAGGTPRRLHCVVSSFGFKYGPQREADWVIDARFLPNPFWVAELRPRTGLDAAVRDYVLSAPETQEFLVRLDPLLTWTISRYVAHGRAALHLAVGCTGGRHRSVAIAVELARRLAADGTIDVTLHHRDVERPDPR